ncbi:phosphoribosylanthranilate isomerase [Halanaerobium hydrogeniformans]|uniref:N-(5'-phosphoribosyl)anthranilate isomerase n=1 Tax=Halanaerobium hydrogeniformans TaxID=656519 RepID=E4RK00_HALHG|nr:phosphoribosylanthranilate isomerase [Halanaerobium hydrogeniformans]ADQ15570.1 Phosphoribosylanthranilate isomerase [Halanaerobium hydrogeniformans]
MSSRVMIKLCGMTLKRNVDFAVESGVDALGFILAKSPRQITLAQAKELTKDLPPFINRVAVVVNPQDNELEKILASRLFDYIQFHGDESPLLIEKTPLKTIKAISINEAQDLDRLKRYKNIVDYFLFDTKIAEQIGGTGQSFDWSLLKDKAVKNNFILAGGLGPQNIELALKTLEPAAVDLNSQLESSPGIKNEVLINKTIAKIRAFEKNNH